jgi:transposase
MTDQVIIGMDPHKSSNTIAVLARDETMLARRRFQHSDDGFVEMLEAVAGFPDRVWAIEGANGMGRSIAQRLVAFDEIVVDVPAKLATRVRVYSTGHGTKTDAADAEAIARAAIHSPHLRRVLPDDATVAMKLLSDRRTELVGSRTQAMCRLHRLLRELIPGGAPTEISAETAFGLLNDLKPDDPANQMRLEIAIDHIEDVMRLDRKIDDYTRRIVSEVKASGTTLTRIYGVGPLNAALIIGEVGDVSRFPSRDHFASYTGTAPIAASSGDHHRHRLNRAGNRTMNHALHIAAIVQIRYDTPGRAYYLRKIAEGKSKKQAIRCVKRRISDAVWRQLQIDRADDQHQDDTWPRWGSSRGGMPHYRSPDTPRVNGRPKQPRPATV